jgi:gas vesicle protein
MASKVISFRFDDDKLALLKQHQVEGESENQTAMRLLLSALGVDNGKLSIQSVDIVDSIRTEIKESIADGDIRYAIAHSYQSSINQFNGHLEELQNQIADLKKQVQELQSISPSTAPFNSPSADNSPAIDNSPALEIPPNDMQNIRSTLNRKNIRVRADEIRAAFKDAGWTGNNFQEIRKDILKILGGDK